MGNGLIQKLCDSNVVGALCKEFSDGDVVLKELGHRRVQILLHCRVEKLCHSDIVGAARAMEELGHSNVIALL